jgi:hypothetical protein
MLLVGKKMNERCVRERVLKTKNVGGYDGRSRERGKGGDRTYWNVKRENGRCMGCSLLLRFEVERFLALPLFCGFKFPRIRGVSRHGRPVLRRFLTWFKPCRFVRFLFYFYYLYWFRQGNGKEAPFRKKQLTCCDLRCPVRWIVLLKWGRGRGDVGLHVCPSLTIRF